jgi:acetylglutamate/LysW-gamma-L-alpha-aminoadipate kinase
MNDLLVVKIGGSSGLNMTACAHDIAQISRDRPVIVVHGVSERMNEICADLGHPVIALTSPDGHESRYTDAQTRDIFVQAADDVNEYLVSLLHGYGAIAHSMSGNPPTQAQRKNAIRAVVNGRVRIIRDDYSGQITHVNVSPLRAAIHNGVIAVVPPYAISQDGFLNVDGDRAAASIAGALGADELLILSNVRGLYREFPYEDTFVHTLHHSQIEDAIHWAQGRMKRKVIAARDALENDVSRVVIGDGRATNPVESALRRNGTEFLR